MASRMTPRHRRMPNCIARAIPRTRLYRLPGRDHQLNNDLTEIAAMIKSLAAEA
jgi:hypothetical protein